MTSSTVYYTYLWLRQDGTPYYVGKGKGSRAFYSCKGHRPPPLDRILVQEFPSEADALAAEIFLIAFYGRKDLGAGCLRNLTDGGQGVTNGSESWLAACRSYGSIGGKIGGRWAVESGHLDRIRTREVQVMGGRVGGHTQGIKNAASGHLARIGKEHGAKNFVLATHTRWHVRRKVTNPNCSLCLG